MSTSVAKGPSREAAMDHSESPGCTMTSAFPGYVACRDAGRLRSPGSTTGCWGFHPGLKASTLEEPVSTGAGAPTFGVLCDVGVHDAPVESVVTVSVACHPGSGCVAACAAPEPSRFRPSTAAARRSIKPGLNLEMERAAFVRPLRCIAVARKARKHDAVHHVAMELPTMLAEAPKTWSREDC